jgi:hypothetical protein
MMITGSCYAHRRGEPQQLAVDPPFFLSVVEQVAVFSKVFYKAVF